MTGVLRPSPAADDIPDSGAKPKDILAIFIAYPTLSAPNSNAANRRRGDRGDHPA
jgi:hypothetical protein